MRRKTWRSRWMLIRGLAALMAGAREVLAVDGD